MKALIAVSMVVLFMAGVNCEKQEERGQVEEQLETSQPAAPPPSMGLHEAALTGNLEVIRGHIEAGSDLNVKDPAGGASPLTTAAVFGQTEAALALIEAGADLNFRGNDGATPLHVAAFFCRTEIVKALIEKGADRTIKNEYGSTPLDAVSAKFEDVKPVYDHYGTSLEPLGLRLDYERIKAARPLIAAILRAE